MAFNGDNMTSVGGNSRAGENTNNNAPMSWSYQSTVDDLATVLSTGYFDTFNKLLVAGHNIYVNLPNTKGFLTVQSVDRVLRQVVIDPGVILAPSGGSIALARTEINDSDYTVLEDDYGLFYIDINAPRIVTIPQSLMSQKSGFLNREWTLGDESDKVSFTNTITLLVEILAITLTLDSPTSPGSRIQVVISGHPYKDGDIKPITFNSFPASGGDKVISNLTTNSFEIPGAFPGPDTGQVAPLIGGKPSLIIDAPLFKGRFYSNGINLFAE